MSAFRSLLQAVERGQPGENATDAELLRRFGDHRDEAAFAEIVRRHGRLVWAVCRRMLRDVQEAEDAFQATFLVLARSWARACRPGTAAGFLFGVARRVALKARARARPQADQRPTPALAPDAATEAAVREVQAIIDQEIARLPEAYRLPLLLCVLEGRSRAEAAAQLGLKAGTLSARLARSRLLLRDRLARRGVRFATGCVVADLSAASAVVPCELPRAAVAVAMGRVSPAVANLAQGLARSGRTLFAPAAAAFACVVAVALTFGAPQPPSAPPEPPPPPAAPVVPDPLPSGAVARFGTTRFRHGQWVQSVAFSPDGKELASCSFDGTVRFWDPRTGREIRRLPRRFDTPGLVAYTAGGRELIVSEGTWPIGPGRSQFQGARVWDVKTGNQLATLTSGSVTCLAVTPAGERLAVLVGNTVTVFDPARHERITAIAVQDCLSPVHVALSADGRNAAVGLHLPADGTTDPGKIPAAVRVYDVRSGQPLWERKGTMESPSWAFPAATFSPDGKWVAVSFSRNKPMDLLKAKTGSVVRPFGGESVGQWPFQFTPGGDRLLAAAAGGGLAVWEVASGRLAGTWPPADEVFALALSPDGKAVASAGRRQVRVLDASTGKPTIPDDMPTAEIEHLAPHPDGRRLLAGGPGDPETALAVWDRSTGRRLWAYPGSISTFGLADRGGEVILGRFRDPPARLDLDARKVVGAGGRDAWPVRTLARAPDGRRFAYIGWDATKVFQLDPETLRTRPVLEYGPGSIAVALAFFPAGDRLAVVRSRTDRVIPPDGRLPLDVEARDLATGKHLRTFEGLLGAFPATLAVSPDGRRVAAGSANTRYQNAGNGSDTRVLVWDADTGALQAQLPGGADGHRCIAFSPDGRTVAAGGEDHSVYTWEVASGQVRSRLTGHEGPVTAVAFTPDGRMLFTGSSDTTVLAWDLTQPTGPALEASRAWDGLLAADLEADRAIRSLLAAPVPAVKELARHLRKGPSVDAGRVKQWVADLDSKTFAVREAATKELARLGPAAKPALKEAQGTASPEAGRRLAELIRVIDNPLLAGEALREARAVEVLERLGTPGALQVLEELAAGRPGVRLTEEAKAAIERSQKRGAVTPR